MASPGKPAGLFVCPEVTAMTCRECPYNDRPRCGKDFCIRPGPCPFVKRDGEHKEESVNPGRGDRA